MSRKDGAKSKSDLRRARLSASLRENLKRRKSQQRLRAEAAAPRADDKAAASDPKRKERARRIFKTRGSAESQGKGQGEWIAS